MDNNLDFFDSDISIENKNIILNGGKTDEISWGLSIPVNEKNKNLLNVDNNNFSTSCSCLLNVNNSLYKSKINIDKYNCNENTIDATLYPNYYINKFLNTEIRKLVNSENIKWDAFSYQFSSTSAWDFCGHQSTLLKFYYNGANNSYGNHRVYKCNYNWDSSSKEYTCYGLGAFKDFQLHPQMPIMNVISRINSVYRLNNSDFYGDVIDTSDISVHDCPIMISCGQKLNPYNNNQFICWNVGAKNEITAKSYQDGTFAIPVAKMGGHICTECDTTTDGVDSQYEGDRIVFNRNCQIQVEKMNVCCNLGTIPNNEGKLVLSLFKKNDIGYTEHKLWQCASSLLVGTTSATTKFHCLPDIQSYTQQSFLQGNEILNTITCADGDYIRFYLDCSNGKKINMKYLNIVIKLKYVDNSYQITDDDYDCDMEYYSGLVSQYEDYEDHSNLTAWINKIKNGKLFAEPYLECMYDHYNGDEWTEIPTYNYYSFYTNLGELTPLKLLSDLCVIYGWQLIQNFDGSIKLLKNKSIQTISNSELESVDYLNETFGKKNYVAYSDDRRILVGEDNTNENLEAEKTLFDLSFSYPKYIGSWYYHDEYEQNGGVDEDDTCKFNEKGNACIADGVYGGEKDTLKRSVFFEEIIGSGKSYIYTFTVYNCNVNSNIIYLNGIKYMVISSKIDIANNTTEIKCFRL